jgi:hypothetical protein
MDIKKEEATMLKLIEMAQKDSLLELEFSVKSSIGNKINKDMFNNVVKKIKGINGIKMQSNSETLDIFLEKSPNMRYSIQGNQAINKYCKSNNLSTLNSASYSLMSKKLKEKLDINNYNIRANLKREEPKKVDLKFLNTWSKYLKLFRYKKRFSYITQDKLFSFDLTVIKTSSKTNKKLPNQNKPKKQIEDFLKKFVIKPLKHKTKNFDDWWDELKPNDIVEIKGKTVEDYVYSKTLQTSNVLTNDHEYEIELEYLGNKINYKSEYNKILEKIINNIGIILQAVQKSNFIISNKEKQMVKMKLKSLMNTYNFSGPQNITLEMKHIAKHDYVDYSKLLSIRRQYSVTEKADGERNICVVLDNEGVYFINRKNEIKYFGCKLIGLANSIFDGELILKDKNDKNINLFAMFDIYFHNGTDLRDRILNRTDDQKEKESVLESRQEVLSKIFDELKLETQYNNIITKKKYYYGDLNAFNPRVNEEIIKKTMDLELLDEDDEKYIKTKEYITKLESDTKIFKEIETVMNTEYIYKTDGLVFTPVNLAVGDEMNNKPPRFDGRWNKLFKWKPPEENTIDFKVQIKKEDGDSGDDEIRYITHRNKAVAYKILVLNVGYNPEIHTKHNSCRVLNEELQFKNIYGLVPFQPHNPYVKNIELAYIPINNQALFCENREVITNDVIVEFSYDASLGEGFCWKPLRVRNNFMPNDFVTAINVWRTIHEPITKKIIFTGELSSDYEGETYYFNTQKRKDINTKPMADFHSFIKKTIITSASNNNDNLLDVSCGRGGDLAHWLDSKLKMVVGIDINRDNLDNINNGICNRVLESQMDNKSALLKNILVIWGDTTRIINTGDAAKDDLNKYYLDVIYGNVDLVNVNNSKLKRFYGVGSNKFNVVSCQFSFHYFFENSIKLDIFLTNISENLKKGGKFVGTCLDGKRVFEALKTMPDLTVYENDKLLWKIIKKYSNVAMPDDSSSVGMPIDVYIESIGKTTQEWLVNFDYLATKALEYGLELKDVTSFEDHFTKLSKSKKKYGSMNQMSQNLKLYSFMNTSFVFEKQ